MFLVSFHFLERERPSYLNSGYFSRNNGILIMFKSDQTIFILFFWGVGVEGLGEEIFFLKIASYEECKCWLTPKVHQPTVPSPPSKHFFFQNCVLGSLRRVVCVKFPMNFECNLSMSPPAQKKMCEKYCP